MYDGQTGAVINGNIITLHFVDGLRGDEDISVNGSIKEPGGPAKSSVTSVPEITEKGGMVIYPNPVAGHITLQCINIMPGHDYHLKIHSLHGKLVYEKIIDFIDANQEFVVQIDDLPDGIYLISLSGNSFNYRSRFMKLK